MLARMPSGPVHLGRGISTFVLDVILSDEGINSIDNFFGHLNVQVK